MKRSLFLWQIIGFAFVSVTGTLLHFVFEWSNSNIVVGLFSAVNESIWEHIKLVVCPLLVFAIIERRYFKDIYNFWCAKLLGILTGMILIPCFYYTYTGAFGIKMDWVNILIFFITAAISFILETKILKSSWGCHLSPTASKLIILFICCLFIVFTFIPPQIPLFIDPQESTYGYFNLF